VREGREGYGGLHKRLLDLGTALLSWGYGPPLQEGFNSANMWGEGRGIEAFTRGSWSLGPSYLAGSSGLPYRKVSNLVMMVG
jgi:hypothetical protein